MLKSALRVSYAFTFVSLISRVMKCTCVNAYRTFEEKSADIVGYLEGTLREGFYIRVSSSPFLRERFTTQQQFSVSRRSWLGTRCSQK